MTPAVSISLPSDISRQIRPSTFARGYGWKHQKLRESLAPLVAGGTARCTKCGLLIEPGSAWDLDHRDDRKGYNGPAHRRCNRATNRKHSPRVSVRL